MPKLYFRYGTMNSSKTANLLMVAHNYKCQGKRVILMKPIIDTRFGSDTINSRSGMLSLANLLIKEDTNIKEEMSSSCKKIDCILVDECQFLSRSHIDELRELAKSVPVICYGLRTDYKLELFPGSKRLMELADTIEEIKTICVDCNKKAIVNAKFGFVGDEKELIKSGSSEPELGAEEKYQAMCYNCWSQ